MSMEGCIRWRFGWKEPRIIFQRVLAKGRGGGQEPGMAYFSNSPPRDATVPRI